MNPALSNNLIGRFFREERDALVCAIRNQDNARLSPTVFAIALRQRARQLLAQRGENCRYRAFRRAFQQHHACDKMITEELTRWLCVATAHTAREHPVAPVLLHDATAHHADQTDPIDELFY